MAQCLAKCTKCGTILQVESTMEAAVCPKCGAAFSMEKAIQNYFGSQGAPVAQPAPQPEKKKVNAWAIVAIILAVAILLGGSYFVFFNDNDKDRGRDDDDESISEVDPDALEGHYVSESGLYEITFKDDFTCVWYQHEMYGNDIYFDGTYEKVGDVYYLYIDGESYSYNTRFEAVPVEDGFIVTGGVVYGEYFRKD